MSADLTLPAAEHAAPVLEVTNLTIDFDLGDARYPVVSDVSLRVHPGERVALVGESGSGKTVTILSLLGLLPPIGNVRAGEVLVAGHRLTDLPQRSLDRIRGKDAAMIFQDPMSSLNPLLRVEQQLASPMRRHLGLTRAAARSRALELLRQVGIPEPDRCLRAYPHELSGGMRQRVMIATALSCKPRLLLADEPTTALDVTIQAQIVELLKDLTDNLGVGCVLVTHDLGVVARFAHRVAVMYSGRIVEQGPVGEVFANPRHPYTQALMNSVPTPTQDTKRLYQIDGAPPGLKQRGHGCAFEPRCPMALQECKTLVPRLIGTADGQEAACHAVAPIHAGNAPREELSHDR
jgi:peptide/nickel transport system ATP-binding protein